MKNLAKNAIDPYSVELVIGAIPSLVPYFFPKTIPKISKKFPKIKLLLTLRQMIIAGSGITLIPEIAAKKEPGISYIKIENAPKRIIGFF